MSVTGVVVAVLMIVAVAVSVVVVLKRRRSSGTAMGELLFPNTDPIALGGHVGVRFTAAGPLPASGTPVTAALICRELVPGSDHAEPTITVVSRVDCPVRITAYNPVGEAEISVDIPLSAAPTTSFADHRVEWTLTVESGETTMEQTLHVAPVVARAVLQGDVNP